jgi:hypothetical protein
MPEDYIVMAISFPARSVFRPRSVNLSHAGQLTQGHFKAAFYDRPVLRVPSIIIPREYNYVLFPEADGFRASIEWTESLDFDRRLVAAAGK